MEDTRPNAVVDRHKLGANLPTHGGGCYLCAEATIGLICSSTLFRAFQVALEVFCLAVLQSCLGQRLKSCDNPVRVTLAQNNCAVTVLGIVRTEAVCVLVPFILKLILHGLAQLTGSCCNIELKLA